LLLASIDLQIPWLAVELKVLMQILLQRVIFIMTRDCSSLNKGKIEVGVLSQIEIFERDPELLLRYVLLNTERYDIAVTDLLS
jgi:hypothetical protein